MKPYIYRLFRSKIFRLLYMIFCLFPIKSNKILFLSDSSSTLKGNFEFLYNTISKHKYNREFDVKFLLKESIDTKKTYLEIILLAYNIATSRYIFLDDFYPMIYHLRIRKRADLIQVWHAVGAFKKFGFSRTGLPGGPAQNSINHKNYTKVVVSSKNAVEHYAEGFGISKDKVYTLGVPRTDVFFSAIYIENKRKELYELLPIDKSKKVILFAPTFRGNGQNSSFYPMENLDMNLLFNKLSEDYIFIIKLHPFIKKKVQIPSKYSNFFYDFSEFKEINDLLLITDLLITDYSSVCFEYALLKRPMLFFAFDLDEYIQQRDFYSNYKDFIPGPIVSDTIQIVDTIMNNKYETEKIDRFVSESYDHLDGRSSERVVNELIINNP
ncbi:MAG: CDP-glycerol glycerophosphotransferase family protein [Bacillota bacterium]|nr:CDP-glycerol glycerophosphotransferase family protein [Bacillota bacterium]